MMCCISVLFSCCIFHVIFLCYIFRVVFLCYIFQIELVVQGNIDLSHIEPLKNIKLIASVSICFHWDKLCSFYTILELSNYTLETLKARLYNNYEPIRTSGPLWGSFVEYFLCRIFRVVFFCLVYISRCIKRNSLSTKASSVICYLFGRF